MLKRIINKLGKINICMWVLTILVVFTTILDKEFGLGIVVLLYCWLGYWIGCENK